jgi:hypothetical protein
MDPILRKSLTAVKAGHEGLLAGFGLERYIEYGPPMGTYGRQWQERLVLRGTGAAMFENVRSITDGSGDEVGTYRGSLSPGELGEVIDLIESTGILEEAPYRIEPADMLIRITLIVGGIETIKYIGVNEPERLTALQPLFNRLQQIEMGLREKPSRSLGIEMTAPDVVTVGQHTIPVTLRFVNRGTEAYWILHPRALGKGAYYDRCTLHYGYRAPIQRGVTPLPIEVMEAPLYSDTETGLRLIWMPAGGAQEVRLLASVHFQQPGEHLLRAVYSNYTGEDAVGGVPRMRACVFSAEKSIPVSG